MKKMPLFIGFRKYSLKLSYGLCDFTLWNMILFYQDGLNILICCVYDILNRFWLCTFTLTVSLGAVLLLPMSIFSNEIMIMYPNSYYIKWLNGSLIHGKWFKILSCYVNWKKCHMLRIIGRSLGPPHKIKQPFKTYLYAKTAQLELISFGFRCSCQRS